MKIQILLLAALCISAYALPVPDEEVSPAKPVVQELKSESPIADAEKPKEDEKKPETRAVPETPAVEVKIEESKDASVAAVKSEIVPAVKAVEAEKKDLPTEEKKKDEAPKEEAKIEEKIEAPKALPVLDDKVSEIKSEPKVDVAEAKSITYVGDIEKKEEESKPAEVAAKPESVLAEKKEELPRQVREEAKPEIAAEQAKEPIAEVKTTEETKPAEEPIVVATPEAKSIEAAGTNVEEPKPAEVPTVATAKQVVEPAKPTELPKEDNNPKPVAVAAKKVDENKSSEESAEKKSEESKESGESNESN